MPYVLEAQKLVDGRGIGFGGNYLHMGYINKVFTSQQEAADYYNYHNPLSYMALNGLSGWITPAHSISRIRYVIREYTGEVRVLPPFR